MKQINKSKYFKISNNFFSTKTQNNRADNYVTNALHIKKNLPFNNIYQLTIHKEKKNKKSLIMLFTMLHTPFYLISIPLGFYGSPANFESLIDWARLGLRSVPIIQTILSGINITCFLNNLEDDLNNKIHNQLDINNDYVNLQQTNINNSIYLALTPGLINFLSSQVLLNSAIITNQILFFSFSGFILSNLIHLYVIYRKVNNNTVSSYLKLNILFSFFNLISFLLFLKFIQSNKDKGFKRVNDENRLENLSSIDQIANEDTKFLEEEIQNLYQISTPELLIKIEEIYENEDNKK